MNMREHKVCVCMHTRVHRGVELGGGCVCSGTVCSSPWHLSPHTRAFQKVTGMFIPPPAWVPAKELQALVYLLVRKSVYGFPAAGQPEIHAHTHSHGCGDRVSYHRVSHNLGPGRFAPHGDRDDPPAAPGRHTTNSATPKAPGKCESQLPWLWSCALAPPPELITA